MSKNQAFTPIEKIGRNSLIEKITSDVNKHSDQLIYGIGDDAAVLNQGEGKHLLVSTELYSEGVHFDLIYTPLQHLGFKLVSLAISDILAMNALPTAITVSLGLTNKISVEMTELFYSGVKSACQAYNVELAGGDISASQHAMTIGITAVGTQGADKTVYRSGAKPGEAICITGDLGGAASGLMILLREKKHFETSGGESMEPDLSPFEYVVRRQLVPEARIDLIKSMEEHGIIPGAMIDLSQGLNRNLLDITGASGCGAIIYEAALPVSPETRAAADELEEDIDKFVLFGGEEPELLFTLPEDDIKKFADLFKDFVVIGKMIDKKDGVSMQTAEGHRMTLH